MLARKEALERLAARREERGRDGESWEEQAALLQRRSARKRAIDEALDLAGRPRPADWDEDDERQGLA